MSLAPTVLFITSTSQYFTQSWMKEAVITLLEFIIHIGCVACAVTSFWVPWSVGAVLGSWGIRTPAKAKYLLSVGQLWALMLCKNLSICSIAASASAVFLLLVSRHGRGSGVTNRMRVAFCMVTSLASTLVSLTFAFGVASVGGGLFFGAMGPGIWCCAATAILSTVASSFPSYRLHEPALSDFPQPVHIPASEYAIVHVPVAQRAPVGASAFISAGTK
jgi:hypothetical protein